MEKNSSTSIAKAELVRRGIKFSEDYFLRYLRSNNIEVVSLYLQAGISPNSSIDGESALAVAINSGNKEIIKILLDAGAKPISLLDGLNTPNNHKDIWQRHVRSCTFMYVQLRPFSH